MSDRPGLHPFYRMHVEPTEGPREALCGTVGEGRTHQHWCQPGKHYWRCPGWLKDCTESWERCPDHDKGGE